MVPQVDDARAARHGAIQRRELLEREAKRLGGRLVAGLHELVARGHLEAGGGGEPV